MVWKLRPKDWTSDLLIAEGPDRYAPLLSAAPNDQAILCIVRIQDDFLEAVALAEGEHSVMATTVFLGHGNWIGENEPLVLKLSPV